MTSRYRPLTLASPTITVREARDRYLAENGFSTASYADDYAKLSLFGLPIVIPNSDGRKRGLPLHDLHHVALGYGTDLAGECEVSAWEIRTGLGGHGLFVRLLVLQAVLLGLFVAPRRVFAAFSAARVARSLYVSPPPYGELLDLTVGELRTLLGVPNGGLAETPPRTHDGVVTAGA